MGPLAMDIDNIHWSTTTAHQKINLSAFGLVIWL